MALIDIGSAATNRNQVGGATHTFVDLANPVAAVGTITSIEVWSATNLGGFRVGTFSKVGDVFTCRDSDTIGSVTAGSKQTFPVSIHAQTGDYLGCYAATGTIEMSDEVEGGSGIYMKTSTEVIDPGDSDTFTEIADYDISIYGTGTTIPGAWWK